MMYKAFNFSTILPALVIDQISYIKHVKEHEALFIVLLIHVFLVINHDEHRFKSLLAICPSSWDECLFRSFGHFFDLGGIFSVKQGGAPVIILAPFNQKKPQKSDTLAYMDYAISQNQTILGVVLA